MTIEKCPYCNELIDLDSFENELTNCEGTYTDDFSTFINCPECKKSICVTVHVAVSFSLYQTDEDGDQAEEA